ncbi:MAG: hypothetical protein NTZ21_19610, partial [Actinobacteria bacterium]|nr:hypothetical protein [Actinomycetota bacterium]
GAVNHTDRFRYVLTNSCVKPWARQQENFLLGTRPEVLEAASPKLLSRLGLQSSIASSLVEGFGYRGTGRAGDTNGHLAAIRHEYDHGGYRHVGELSMQELDAVDLDALSLAKVQREFEEHRDPAHVASMAALNDLLPSRSDPTSDV